MSDPHGPRILSLGTSVNQLTEGESARFVAVVTHPDGLDKLAGGQLTSTDGKIKYGAFLADHQGAYTLDLSWALLNQTQSINFASEDMRPFTAEFYDMLGHKTSQALNLRLHCNGKNACAGACLDQGDQCRSSTNLCISGACKPGCFIAGALTATDSSNPDPGHGSCLVCKPMSSYHDWTATASGTVCGTNKKCAVGGDCGNVFTRQTVSVPYLTDVWGSSASNVYAVGHGFSSDTTLLNSTDGGLSWQASGVKITTGYYTVLWGVGTSTLYVTGDYGAIMKTVNAGSTWTTVASGLNSMHQIWSSSASDLWAVGSGGTVLHSTDSGATWPKVTLPVAFATKEISSVWGSAANDVYIGTESGYVLHTINGGASFTSMKTKRDESIYRIWGSGKSDVYALANAGISRTTDSGVTWTEVTPTLSSSFNTIWGSGAGDIYVGVYNGVLRSTNSGKTWYRQYLSSSDTGVRIWGSGANDVFVVGANSFQHYP